MSEYIFEALENPDSTVSMAHAISLGREYGELMVTKTLSDADEQRMDEILALATVHEIIDFWVSYEGCIRGMEIGLVNESAIANYEDQKAWLREYLGMTPGEETPPQETAFANQALTVLEIELREQISALNARRAAKKVDLEQIFRAAKVSPQRSFA